MGITIDATNLIVAAGVAAIVGAGSWLLVGPVVLWALWQVVSFYVVLLLVAAAMYGVLVLFVGRHGGESSRDKVIGE